MRYTDIDGDRYEVKDCAHCPFSDMSDGGWSSHCTHPKFGHDNRTPLDIDSDGFAKSCPLREVEGMNDREILQALLDGKVIAEKTHLCPLKYRLNGDRMEVKYGKYEWSKMDHIPEIDSDYVRIEEMEE